MTNKKPELKTLKYKKRKGILEVTLRDEYFDPIYKSEARVNDKKDMMRIQEELTLKGLSFPKDWWRFNAFDKTKRQNKK